jgi:hypothetical protein
MDNIELYVLMKDGQPVVVTSQGKKQPKVYLSQKNANNAVANMKEPGITVVPFIPKD